MGKTSPSNLPPFINLQDKQLVIEILTYEESLTKSDFGKQLYQNKFNRPFVSLDIETSIIKLVLNHFGFNTSEQSVSNYRSIFKTYFRSALDYDKDVINSVHYMRENKCVFYQSKEIKNNDIIPNCNLYLDDGQSETTLYDIIKEESRYTMICAFSLT